MTASGDSSLEKESLAAAERKQNLRAHLRSVLAKGLAVRKPQPGGDTRSSTH